MATADTAILAGQSGVTSVRRRIRQAKLPWVPIVILAALVLLAFGGRPARPL